MFFSQIPGVQSVKTTLAAGVYAAHVAHAQLFVSREGGAALPLALAYAALVNCENLVPEAADACGHCASCYKIKRLIHPDVHFVFPTATTKQITKRDEAVSSAFLKEWRSFMTEAPYGGLQLWSQYLGAENKQCIIPVQEGRNIIKELSLKAFEARYKIMIIWMPELMNVNAANAILKILEEPPPFTLFLLVTHRLDQLLGTITSRTQLINIPPFSDEDVASYLETNLHLPPQKAQAYALLADGSLGEAIQLASQETNVSAAAFQQWMRVCFKVGRQTKGAFTELLKESEYFAASDKEAQKSFLRYGLSLMREACLSNLDADIALRVAPEDRDFVINFGKILNLHNLETISRKMELAIYYIERNASAKITFMELSLYTASQLQPHS